MTGERVDFWAAIDAFYDLDADTRKALFDEFYYEDRSIGRDAMLGTIHTLRAQVAALAGEKAADKARLDWMEAQFADHNRDCMLTLSRWQYDRELALDIEGASWSRMTIRSSLDAARGGEG